MNRHEKTLIRETIEDFKKTLESGELDEREVLDIESRIDCLNWVLEIAGDA